MLIKFFFEYLFYFFLLCLLYKDEIIIDIGGIGICWIWVFLIICDGVIFLMS